MRFVTKLSKREKLLLLGLVLLATMYTLVKLLNFATSFYLTLKSENLKLKNLLDTYLILARRKHQLESVKASLENLYKTFIWESEDTGDLTRFEQIKTAVSKEGIVLDQFKVEMVSSAKFSNELTKSIFRISFHSNRLSGIIQYLLSLFSGDFKALPLKVSIEKKASNDGLITSLELLILKKTS